MKNPLFFAVLILVSFGSFSQEKRLAMTSDITTYYLIRHAEKDRNNSSGKNPHLTAEGLKRADHWSKILGNIKFDAIYSTDYIRTKETAQPTADKNKLTLKLYDFDGLNINLFKEETKGKTVLIVGHSDTTPSFVNKIIGLQTYKDIDDSNNGNLYIVTIIDGKPAVQVLTIN